MKARPFLASVLAVLLLALSLGGAGWWLVWQRSPLQLQHRALVLPRAARFIPRDVPLALHLLSDGREPVGYARAVAPSRSRREAGELVERLRDGAFAAAGLDYPNELAGWLAPQISLALFEHASSREPPPPEASRNTPARTDAPASLAAAADPPSDWLLVLRSRDAGGARRFLQRFWQTRSLAGTDLQVSSYRGMGLISGRGALVGRQAVPLATALIDDDLLLIASGRGALEEALDVSQIDELNQAADPGLKAALARLGPGAALLVANGTSAVAPLDLPLPATRPGSPQDPPPAAPLRLLASLRPDGSSLRLEALLDPAPTPLPAAALDSGERRRLLAQAPSRAASLALLQNPAAFAQAPLLSHLLERAVLQAPDAGPLPPLVLAQADGPLLAAAVADDWLLATPAARPEATALEAPLAAEGLIPAPLEVDGRSVTVWTRLEASGRGIRAGRDGRDRLQAPLEGWRGERDGLALWGRSLALLEREADDRGSRSRERQLDALELPAAPFQWALDAASTRDLLAGWTPWRRLAGLSGGGLDGSVHGLALALEPGAEGLRLRGRLELGAGR